MKRYKAKSTKEKGRRAKSEGSQMPALKEPIQVESHRTYLIPPATIVATWVNCLPGKLVRDSESKVFIGR